MNVILKQTAATAVPVKPATTIGVIFGATPGMPGIFNSNFDYQLVRGMLAGTIAQQPTTLGELDGKRTARILEAKKRRQ